MDKKILIVEDERLIALDLEYILKGFGFRVVGVVSSSEEAMRAVEAVKPDLVIMDIKLKGEVDGVETARRIAERFPVSVVYLSAYSDSRTMQRATIDAPFRYLRKPFGKRELYESIKEVLNQ